MTLGKRTGWRLSFNRHSDYSRLFESFKLTEAGCGHLTCRLHIGVIPQYLQGAENETEITQRWLWMGRHESSPAVKATDVPCHESCRRQTSSSSDRPDHLPVPLELQAEG